MSHKWKFILTNWINCYFNEGGKKEHIVNLESLLSIISHLRENLNLDESKSSILEAHTVEEFVHEKYPQFKFENGTVEATNEEELYIVASLLLFFVCVNSKDVDIRNAMCSKLSSEDQETIMRFSKALMECSPITCSDVQAAITEACGQDIAAVESVTGAKTVAETPPALRSLHGEVRRLQAALEAERFDRNYLQDELARTNLKLEKLLKDKEQYKLDIVNLKAKISLCCGQEAEVQGGDAASESSSRLTRQLEDLEERLVVTQEQLDDALLERDTYKTKVEQLKQERDKWLSVSQTEASRAAQLTQELETERHHVQSLQDLVTELRQHNLKNCLDASQLECDDPDASILSLHNASVCSEACANVIEVQLSEERAKIVVLKQQIQGLQDQLVDLNQRAENETQSLRSIITENDNNILNLKHRINEEIEEKNNIRAHFSEEMGKLNNEITELEQKLKHNSESSRQVIEQKMQEIQTLQEEKLSLLQSLSDETTKLECIIKDLRTDNDSEKNLKLKMKEDYENKMMKLNEKVLNRNNELVELQNNIFEKSELIEQLYQNLRKEKETKEELSNKCNDTICQLNERNDTVERNFQQKCEEAKELQKRLQQNGVVFSELNKEIDDLKAINSDLSEKCRILEDTKASLLNDLQHHAYKIEEIQREMTNVHQLFCEEKEELIQNLNERHATIDTLQTQLHDEIQYKTGLQNELAILQQARTNLSEEVNKLNTEMTTLKSDVLDKDRMIYALDLYLKEEKHTNKNLKQDCDMMNEELKKMSEQITKKENEIIEINNKLETESRCLQEVLREKEELIVSINNQLSSEIAEKNTLITTLNSLNEEKDSLVQDLSQQYNDNTILKENNEKLTQFADKNNMIIETLEKKMEVEVKKYTELENTLQEQIAELMGRINEYEKIILETNTQFKNTINEKELQIKHHEHELESLNEINKSLKAIQDTLVIDKDVLLVEKEALTKTLNEEKAARDEIENEKDDALIQFKQLNEKYICDMNKNQEELRNTREELNHLKTDRKKYEDDNIEMTSVLNNGIERILQNMAKEEICIEVLQKFLIAGKIEDIPFNEKLGVLINIADTLTTELSLALKNENMTLNDMTEILKVKDVLETEVKSLQDVIQECKVELSQKTETYNNLTESNVKHIKKLELENESLNNELNDVKVKLEEKVRSLNEKLIDTENVTEKLKQTYECQIDNLNLMINKLTSYLKDKTLELEGMRKEEERLLKICEDNKKTIKSLEDEAKSEKQDREKMIIDFESERLVLRNMVTVTESVMEDQKMSLNKAISEHLKANEKLHEDIKALQQIVEVERKNTESKIHEKETVFDAVFKELTALRSVKESLEKETETQNELYQNKITALKMEINDKVTCIETIKSQNKDLMNEKRWLEKEITTLREELETKSSCIDTLTAQNIDFTNDLHKLREDITSMEQKNNELKIQRGSLEFELLTEIDNLTKSLKGEMVKSDKIYSTVHEKLQAKVEIHAKVKILTDEIIALVKEKNIQITKLDELKTKLETNELTYNEEITKLKQENFDLLNIVKENQIVITNQQQLIQHELEQNEKLRDDTTMEKVDLENKLSDLQVYQHTAETQIEEYKTQISSLQNNIDSLKSQLTEEIETLNSKINGYENDLKEKDMIISQISEENDKLCKTIVQVKGKGFECQNKLDLKIANLLDDVTKLKQDNIDALNQIKENQSVIIILEEMIKREKDQNEILREDTEGYERELKEKDEILTKKTEEIDTIRKSLDEEKEMSNTMRKSLNEEKEMSEKYQKELGSKCTTLNEEIAKLKDEKADLLNIVKENETVINILEDLNNREQEQNKKLREDISSYEKDLKEKHNFMSKMIEQIDTIRKALDEEKEIREKYQIELESKSKTLNEEIAKLKDEKADLLNKNKENETLITNQKQLLNNELEQTEKLLKKTAAEKMELENKLSNLEECQNNTKRQFTADFETLKTNVNRYEEDLKEKDIALAEIVKEKQALIEALDEAKGISEKYHRELESTIATLNVKLAKLKQENIELLNKVTDNQTVITNYEKSLKYELEQSEKLREITAAEKRELMDRCSILEEYQTRAEKDLEDHKSELSSLKITINCVKSQLTEQIETLNTKVTSYEQDLKEKDVIISEIIEEKDKLNGILIEEREKAEKCQKDLESNVATLDERFSKVKQENNELHNKMTDDKTARVNQELNTAAEKLNLTNKCSLLQEYQTKAEKQLEEYKTEITSLKLYIDNIQSQFTVEIEALKTKLVSYDHELKERDIIVSRITEEKEALCKALDEIKDVSEKYQRELESKAATVFELRQKLEEVKKEAQVLEVMRKENDNMMLAVGQLETFAMSNQEKSSSNKHFWQTEKNQRDRHQVSTPTSDLTHSSIESFKTISDLEKIIHDKNRTITTLQSDVTYLKSLMADSENKLLDVNKELEVTQDTCYQLSSQLKKIVEQKNEEIADLKKQVTKMCATENRASQIIKVSAKYQAIILKRIAEIKSNTILKEMTNFGNYANSENEVKRSLNSAITMEDLENFLETTDRHLKRCTEKQLALQKDRDRLTEVNRINESEIINLKKFLTELSVSFKTFNSIKELYAQKLTRVVSVQRTVRREILNLDGRITDTMMCKLERGYAAVMQDLSECAMNLERWVERCIGRTISSEKIKQAFSSESDRTSLASISFQNTGLEVQLEELEKSFQKLLEEVVRAQKGEGAKDAQSVTVMEVRAEYEDKLNRMKAKMKQLYQEQIAIFKDKQKDEVAALERELVKAREKLAESSRAYEEHIRALTTELWSVGEKFLVKKEEAEWLRRKQRSGSLMSLQHVHSSGLVPPPEEPSRPSDTHSLRSLPVNTNTIKEKREGREGRGLHMSDEEGEVFDNRWLQELSATPRRESVAPAPGQRLSELRWRNSLCPPHLKSSYPAETQFAAALDEEDIKCVAASNAGKQQRKEVGITAYKKPGPPTPSKQAGRLSATGSELRESLRVEAEPHASRKTSTPSRLRSLFRSARNDTTEGTPRSRRLSNIFRKK